MFSRPMRFLASAAGTGLWFAQPQTVIALFIIRHKVHGWIFDYYADFFLHPASAESLPKRVAARRHLVSCAAFLHILKKAPFGGKSSFRKAFFIYTISR